MGDIGQAGNGKMVGCATDCSTCLFVVLSACGCDIRGSSGPWCDASTGACACAGSLVQGLQCDHCAPLTGNNVPICDGRSFCFCSIFVDLLLVVCFCPPVHHSNSFFIAQHSLSFFIFFLCFLRCLPPLISFFFFCVCFLVYCLCR